MIYPELTVLLSLLVLGKDTREASNLLRRFRNLPLSLSIVHRVQIENLLLRYLHGSDPKMRAIARDGLLLWRQYLEEGVFELRSFPLAEAFAQVAAWNAASIHQPPRWQLWIHVALAATEQASFMCFDPGLRKKASKAGLALVPAKL